MASLVQNVFDMIGQFTDVAMTGPVSAFLMLFGFVFVVLPSLVMAYLAAGAVVDYVIPDSLGRTPPQQG